MRTAQTGRAMALAMAAEDPEYLRKHVVEAGAPDWIDGLIDSLKPRVYCSKCAQQTYERWAFRLWAECAKLVGVTPQIQTLIINQLGVPLTEAQAAVRAMQSLDGLDDAATAEMVLGWLRDYHRARGEEVRIVRVAEAEAVESHNGALPEPELP